MVNGYWLDKKQSYMPHNGNEIILIFISTVAI